MKLYKRNAQGKPLVWSIEDKGGKFDIEYGIVGKTLHKEVIVPTLINANEFKSRINAKRKEGYKALDELKDNSTPVEEMMNNTEDLITYLNTYLPTYNTTNEGFILPMLAKTLEDNTPFERYGRMLGQYKINGLRCIISAEENREDMFNPIKLVYHSREGTVWNLQWLDEIILPHIAGKLLSMMIDEGACLDGELYLPGYSVNDINSFVKNSKMELHKKLQFWCYDICIPNMSAYDRDVIRRNYIDVPSLRISTKEDHLNNKQQFVLLPTFSTIDDIEEAIKFRDIFIEKGFEGLICRKIYGEYQFGKRNSCMFKFKKLYDGKFLIIDIVPQGRRKELPKFVCRNDINGSKFDCGINKTFDTQQYILRNKDKYIGKYLFVEFRERSGVKQLPFHARGINIV